VGKPFVAHLAEPGSLLHVPASILDLDVFCVLDYSGIEVRFLAQMSGDELLISQFNDGFDVHSLVGAEMTGWPAEKIKEDEKTRRIVKNIHFGIIYGVSRDGVYPYLLLKGVFDPTAPPKQIARDKQLSMKYYDRYFARYKRVKKLIDKLRADVEVQGYVSTMFGFRRAITDEDSDRKTYSGNQAVNCVDFETTILTQRGWVSGRELKKSDMCLTESGWQKPVAINLYPNYSGPVHAWNSRSFSAVSTPNHRWKVYNKDRGVDEILTSAGMPKHSSYRVHRTIHEQLVEETYSDDFVSLCGWFLTDGFVSSVNKTGVSLSQSKPSTSCNIQSLLDRLGVKTGYVSNGCNYWYIGGSLGKQLRTLFPERVLTQSFISSLPRRQAILLIDTMLAGDGDKGGRFVCGTRDKATAFEMLCAWAGKTTYTRCFDPTKRKSPVIKATGQVINATKLYYIVRVLRRTKTQVWKNHETIGKGAGVWCPTFKDDAAWVAARSGHTFITKNSPIQGSAHTLMLVCLALLAMKPKTYALLQRPVMEVHDALYFLTKLRHLKETCALAVKLMEQDTPAYVSEHFGVDFKIPIKADAKAGFTLGSLIKYAGQEPGEFLPKWREYYRETEAVPLSDLAA